LKFQRNIFMSMLTTQIQNFLQQLDDKKDIWWDIANRIRNLFITYKFYVNYISKSNVSYQTKIQNQFSVYYHSQFDQYDSQNFKQWNFEQSQRWQSSYQYRVNQFYQSQSQIQNAKQLKNSKSQLQITIDSSSEFAFFSKSYSFRFDNQYNQEHNRERYDRRNSLKRAWNNQNKSNNYNQNKIQKAYTDAIQKNVETVNNVENDHDSKHFANESDKKNEDSYKNEIESKSFNSHDNQKYNYFLNEKDYHINIDIIQRKLIFQCRKCRTKFVSNNKLHKHVRECRKKSKSIIVEFFHFDEDIQETNRIIVFKTKSDFIKDLVFRSWHFATFATRIFKKDSLNELCADSECIMSLIDKSYLKQIVFNVKIHNIDESITVRDIEIAIHNCFEYVKLKLYISDTLKFSNVKEIVKLTRYAHIVNNLRVKFLMKMNILEFEKVILNISRRKMILSLCENLNVNIRITSKLNSKMNQIIFAERFVIISIKTIVTIFIKWRVKSYQIEIIYFNLSFAIWILIQSMKSWHTWWMSILLQFRSAISRINQSLSRAKLD
jgi:hypothetical protein